MYSSFNTDCDSSSRCSTASPAGDNLVYYSSPAGSYSSVGSPLSQSQDYTDLTASSASFIPTITAISSSPDLQWMVQPVVSSVAPSYNRSHPYNSTPSPAYSTPGLIKTTAKGRRGKMEQLSQEEENKKMIRRERNKMAAAKCRNRRRELTDTLQAETDVLEDEKSSLQTDIANLLKEKERLEFILAAHKPICKIPSDLAGSFPETSVSSSYEMSTPLVATAPTLPCGPVFSDGGAAAEKLANLANSLEESLEQLSKSETAAARSVPEVDLSSSLYAQDWEPLYTAGQSDAEPLCTPVVTCTPTCTPYMSSFLFTYPEADAFPTCGVAHRRGSASNDQSSDSLSSPTLLAL